MKFKKEINFFTTCGLKQVIDICVAINHFLKDKLSILKIIIRYIIFSRPTRMKTESTNKVFITSEFAQKTREYFVIDSGVDGPFVQCYQTIEKWWNVEITSRIFVR